MLFFILSAFKKLIEIPLRVLLQLYSWHYVCAITIHSYCYYFISNFSALDLGNLYENIIEEGRGGCRKI